MADIYDDVKSTASSLMNATGVPQMGKAMTKVGETATAAKDYAVKKAGQATDFVKNKFASSAPAKRTADIDLPAEKKKSLRSGRSMSKR